MASHLDAFDDEGVLSNGVPYLKRGGAVYFLLGRLDALQITETEDGMQVRPCLRHAGQLFVEPASTPMPYYPFSASLN